MKYAENRNDLKTASGTAYIPSDAKSYYKTSRKRCNDLNGEYCCLFADYYTNKSHQSQ